VAPTRLQRILARPALHILLALLFFATFAWPIFAVDRPWTTFVWLHGAWAFAIVALLAVSRGQAPSEDEDAEEEAASEAANPKETV